MYNLPPTNTDLYVVAVGRVFEVVYGAHHVQSHVADVMSMIFGLLRSPRYHHVGISNGLNLGVGVEQMLGSSIIVSICISLKWGRSSDLEDTVLLAERVEERVHGVEHGDHLHRGDVAANASEAHDVTEKNGDIWEHLGGWRQC